MPTVEEVAYADKLSRQQRRLLEHLCAGHTGSAKVLADWLYADREDGGPLSAAATVGLQLHRIRKRLRPGWSIGALGIGLKGPPARKPGDPSL